MRSRQGGSPITHDETVTWPKSPRLSAIQTIPFEQFPPLNPKLPRDPDERVASSDSIVDRRGFNYLHPILPQVRLTRGDALRCIEAHVHVICVSLKVTYDPAGASRVGDVFTDETWWEFNHVAHIFVERLL